MIKEATGTGDTIEEARNSALQNLNAPIEADVKVEIVDMPKKKTLGIFGGSLAKVKASYDDGKKEPVPEKKEAPKAAAPKKTAQPAPEKKEPKKEAAPAPKKETSPKEKQKEVKSEPEPEVDLSGIEAKENNATKYLQSVLVGMGFADAAVTVKETDEEFFFEITCGEDYGNIIGRRGETLDALQYLTRLYVNRSEDGNKRVALNVGDYRKRREETLKGLAKRQAARTIKYGRNCVLEPMNPYERRIIHTTVQDIEGVASHSVGEGDARRVVITPVGGERRNGGYNRDNRGGDRGRDFRQGHEKRPPYVPQTSSEPREQKVDVAASSRYGKIEPVKKSEPQNDGSEE